MVSFRGCSRKSYPTDGASRASGASGASGWSRIGRGVGAQIWNTSRRDCGTSRPPPKIACGQRRRYVGSRQTAHAPNKIAINQMLQRHESEGMRGISFFPHDGPLTLKAPDVPESSLSGRLHTLSSVLVHARTRSRLGLFGCGCLPTSPIPSVQHHSTLHTALP